MQTGTLSLEQAPPLLIPVSFFLAVPLGVLAAGLILLANGNLALASPWTPQALALTHAGTLGVLAMGMCGALYQMTPVVAATPVPWTRIAHGVQLFLLTGLAAFLWRLLGGPVMAMVGAIVCLTLAFALFLLPLGWALQRSATKDMTVAGMRLAIASLAIAVLLGLLMARGYAGGVFSVNRLLWVQIHMLVALLGWVGGLIMAVSWQVIPMFYLAPPFCLAAMRWQVWLLLAGLVLPLAFLLTTAPLAGLTPGRLAALAALPAAMACWLVHPVITLLHISRRKRKRSDASGLFWQTGLGNALILIPLGSAASILDDPRWLVLFAWVAIWGWAAMIMHGMLSRIVPFLVWFHRYSAKVGLEPVPSMRSLLSQRRIRTGFLLHSASVVMGVLAIISQMDLLARLTGLLLLATAFSLGLLLISVLRRP